MGIFNFLFNKKSKERKNSEEEQSVYDIPLTAENAKERSDAFYRYHQENIKGFESLAEDKSPNLVLNPREMAFLKYLNGKTLDQIAGYWTHEVNLKINKVIRKLIDNGYLNYSVVPEKSLRVIDLKELLAAKNQKVSGKKAELIERMKSVYTDEELNSLDLKKIFTLTDKGQEIAKATPVTLTRDHVFEKECLELIAAGELDAAFKKVCDFQKSKPASPGLGGWDFEKPEDYYKNNKSLVDKALKVKAQSDPDKSKLYNAIFIYSDMLGMGFWKITKEYLNDWVPGYYTEVPERKLKGIAERESEKYKNYNYPEPNPRPDFKTESKWFERNSIAFMYLMAGRADRALPLYEQSAAEGWDGTAIFEDMIKIYNRFGMEDAVDRLEKRKEDLQIDNH